MQQLVEQTFEREGRVYADQLSKATIDQPTGPGGVTLPTLAAYRGRACTVDDLKRLTLDEAGKIIAWRFTNDLAQLHFDQIAHEPLRLLLLDTEYNSGPGRATRWLQRLLGVATVDGIIGHETATAANALNARDARLLVNAYAAQRAHAAATGNQLYANGNMRRALAFVQAVDD